MGRCTAPSSRQLSCDRQAASTSDLNERPTAAGRYGVSSEAKSRLSRVLAPSPRTHRAREPGEPASRPKEGDTIGIGPKAEPPKHAQRSSSGVRSPSNSLLLHRDRTTAEQAKAGPLSPLQPLVEGKCADPTPATVVPAGKAPGQGCLYEAEPLAGNLASRNRSTPR
jgi:hypothetical protein